MTDTTTTVGKLARVLVADGKSVVLGAADTFRAAAAEQLADDWRSVAAVLLMLLPTVPLQSNGPHFRAFMRLTASVLYQQDTCRQHTGHACRWNA